MGAPVLALASALALARRMVHRMLSFGHFSWDIGHTPCHTETYFVDYENKILYKYEDEYRKSRSIDRS